MKAVQHLYFRYRAQWQFGLLGLGLAGGLTAGLWATGLLPVYGAWLVAAGAVSCAFFGVDKQLAQKKGIRIPELVLHGLNAAGGFVGGVFGMVLFRHKTNFSAHPLFPAVIAVSALLHGLVWWLFGR